MPRLTERIIRELPAPAKANRIIYDGSVPGFGMRITAAGHRAFVLNYRTKDGRERRMTLGAPPAWNLTMARAEAARVRRRIDSGEDPLGGLQVIREAPTVADLAARFEREHITRLRPSTQREHRSLLGNEILPALGGVKVAAVTHADIDRLHQRMSERALYRANRLAALLSKMFSLAIRWQMRPDNPARGVARNDEQKRERYLSGAELAALLAALNAHSNPQAADALRLLLLTGARKNEVLGARWEQFDLGAGTWIKPASATKQAKIHRVPLSAPAVELLRTIPRRGPYLFPSRGGKPLADIKKSWGAICRNAGLADLRIHDLRHSFASILVGSGLSLPTIGALLGHARAETTARYAHLADDPLRQATEKVGQIIKSAGE